MSKLFKTPFVNSKKIRKLNNTGTMTNSSKISKSFNIKSLEQKLNNNFHNNTEFNYKVVALGGKISLENDLKGLYI